MLVVQENRDELEIIKGERSSEKIEGNKEEMGDAVDELKLPLIETSIYGIIMGSRSPIKGRGVCKGVVISLGDLTVVENFLLLDFV